MSVMEYTADADTMSIGFAAKGENSMIIIDPEVFEMV